MLNTIYIKGKGKYRSRIRKELKSSELEEGKDYIPGSSAKTYEIYWLDSEISLRKFKESIGAKYIWKHRIRIFENNDDAREIKIENTYEELGYE